MLVVYIENNKSDTKEIMFKGKFLFKRMRLGFYLYTVSHEKL